jgi:cytochrome P460
MPMRGMRSRRTAVLIIALATLAAVTFFTVITSRQTTAQEAAPVFVKKIPPGYRDWKVVSVAHEAGELNDIRAVLGNGIAIKAYRDGKLPFPEGAVVGRIAWSYVPSEENNKTFGRDQSFVAGSPTSAYLQFMVKDSKKYAATGGWGYSSFDQNGKPTDEAAMKSCFPCHQAIKDRDFIFSKYTP